MQNIDKNTQMHTNIPKNRGEPFCLKAIKQR